MDNSIINKLMDTIQNMNIENKKIQKLELFICVGENGEGRGSTCIHITLPCNDNVCGEYLKPI